MTIRIRTQQLGPLVETPPGSGRYLPERWTSEYDDPEDPDLADVGLGFDMRLVDGAPTWITVTVFPWEPGTVPARDLALPLERIVAEVIDAATSQRPPREVPFDLAAPSEFHRRRNRITDEYLAEVAQIYREAEERGDPPTVAVQEFFTLARSTAGRHVQLARQRGYLSPAQEQETEEQ